MAHRLLRNKRENGRKLWTLFSIVMIILVIVGIFNMNIQPFNALGGAIWLKDGVHYISDTQISKRIEQINAPKEAALADGIAKSTPFCDKVDEGFCQNSQMDYAFKSLAIPAVPYKPGTPDRKEIIGYCTLCNDGTYSPSCAVGRGACSWHGGVSAYNVPEYTTIPGTPEVKAVAAVYSYEPKAYKDSPAYISPDKPSLKEIVKY